VPVRLVEADHERTRDPVTVHHTEQLVVVADHPVDVRAEVQVGVEDVGAVGQRAKNFLVVEGEKLARSCPGVGHGGSLVRVPLMPDVLIYADTFRSPEMRHEVAIGIPDAFLYVEKDGARHIQIGAMEIPRLAALGLYELHPSEEFGFDDLVGSGLTLRQIREEILLRAVQELGVADAVVPATFPLWLADHLRANGIEVTADRDLFEDRRRVKSGHELEGIRRAQTAAEAGMSAARDLLRRASENGNGLVVDGKPLTSELLKSAINSACVDHGASADEFIVSHGAQSAIGHDMDSGPIRPGDPI